MKKYKEDSFRIHNREERPVCLTVNSRHPDVIEYRNREDKQGEPENDEGNGLRYSYQGIEHPTEQGRETAGIADYKAMRDADWTVVMSKVANDLEAAWKLTEPNLTEIQKKMFRDMVSRSLGTTPEQEKGGEWIDANKQQPVIPEGEDCSENVFAIHNDVLCIMAYCRVPGAGLLWANCYGDIDGDAEVDDEYKPTHWQPLPEKPIQ